MNILWYLKVAEIFMKFLYQVLTAVTVLQVPDIELVVENSALKIVLMYRTLKSYNHLLCEWILEK